MNRYLLQYKHDFDDSIFCNLEGFEEEFKEQVLIYRKLATPFLIVLIYSKQNLNTISTVDKWKVYWSTTTAQVFVFPNQKIKKFFSTDTCAADFVETLQNTSLTTVIISSI